MSEEQKAPKPGAGQKLRDLYLQRKEEVRKKAHEEAKKLNKQEKKIAKSQADSDAKL